MYNPDNFSNTTWNTFEILGAYILNVFYNGIYKNAQMVHMEGKAEGLTTAYKLVAHRYIQQFQNPKAYKNTIKDLHVYFSKCHDMPSMTYVNFVDSIVKEFVPSDFYPSLNDKEKVRVLDIVLSDIIKKFATIMLDVKHGLKMVIDDHNNKNNLDELRTKMETIIVDEHHLMYEKFVKKTLGENHSDKLTDKLRAETKRLTRENLELRQTLEKAQSTIKAAMTKSGSIIQNLEKKIDYLMKRAMNDEMIKKQLNEQLQSKISQVSQPLQFQANTEQTQSSLSELLSTNSTSTQSSLIMDEKDHTIELYDPDPVEEKKIQSNNNTNNINSIANDDEEIADLVAAARKNINKKKNKKNNSDFIEKLLDD